MEFGVREWMILIGGLLILAVIADGVRRMIREHRDGIRMSINPNYSHFDDGDDYTSELPGGGARVIPRDSEQCQSQEGSGSEGGDIAMESFGADERVGDTAADHERQPEPVTGTRAVTGRTPRTVRATAAKKTSVDPSAKDTENSVSDFDEMLVMHVLARSDEGFAGAALLELLLACDLRFGDLDIFHRHEQVRGRGLVQFSVANIAKPGTFELKQMKDFHTPGVSLFMRLPGPAKPLEALDCMVETARSIARNLDGEMRDEGHSVLTPQTFEHYRQRVHDFERRRLAGTV